MKGIRSLFLGHPGLLVILDLPVGCNTFDGEAVPNAARCLITQLQITE